MNPNPNCTWCERIVGDERSDQAPDLCVDCADFTVETCPCPICETVRA